MPERTQREHEAPEELEAAEAPEELEPVVSEPVDDGLPEPLENGLPEPVEAEEPGDEYEAPSPIEHAAPDVEIAEAQLELGRLGQLDEDQPAIDEEEPEEVGGRGGGRGMSIDGDFDGEGDGPPGGGGELAMPSGAAAQPRTVPGNRLIGFLQGSWRELQRVQWPDRRQVMQATGVVIGFVIVAGVWLGVSDWVAGKVVSFIINGHF